MPQSRKQPTKHFKFGMEFELFTLDEKGYMTNGADRLIKRVKTIDPKIDIKREVGKNMIEISVLPYTDIPNVMEKAMADFETVLYAAEQEGLVLYPFGTYPGAFVPEMNTDKHYRAQELILGKQRFSITGRCVGLHCHYTLPWGVYDFAKRIIKQLVDSKHKQSMVNMYNLFIAMDPALTTFTQCSPFYQGKVLGKDSRVIVYRGGAVLDYPQGLYANRQKFGGLQPYKGTGTDLLHIIKMRFDEWTRLIEKVDLNVRTFTRHGSILDMAWNPVKVNSNGTMEQRGMDMNHPRIIIAIALIIKYISRAVQERFVSVVPSDIGISDPFKKEGSVIYIPPHTHVRFDLQPKAAYKGLEDDDVYRYCSGLIKLAKSVMPENRYPLLEPLEEMLQTRKTVSDRIVKTAKDLGIPIEEGITEARAAELALVLSKDLHKEVIMTKQALHNLE